MRGAIIACMADTIECDRCGALYEVTYTKIIFRDKDTADCDVCGERIDSWNGSQLPHHKLVRGATKPWREGEASE